MVNSEYNIKELKGLAISRCFRNFQKYDASHIPNELKDLELDGDIYILFSNDIVLKLSSNSELFSVKIEQINEFEESQFTDITENKFWSERIGKSITNVEFLCSELQNPYCLKFHLENNSDFLIEYISESAYEFDAIVIRGFCTRN